MTATAFTTLVGFNSRTPGGVRRRIGYEHAALIVFQFTHPGRGATKFMDVA